MPKSKILDVVSTVHVALPDDQFEAVKAAANKLILGRQVLGDLNSIPPQKLSKLADIHKAAHATEHGELLIHVDLSSGALIPARLLLNGKTYEIKET